MLSGRVESCGFSCVWGVVLGGRLVREGGCRVRGDGRSGGLLLRRRRDVIVVYSLVNFFGRNVGRDIS